MDDAEIEINIQESETNKSHGNVKTKAKKGLNTFVVRTKKFAKNKHYHVQINYKSKDSSGSFSNSVKTKH